MFYGDYQVQIVRKTRDKAHEAPHYIITQMTISQVGVAFTEVLVQVLYMYFVIL